MKKWIYIILFQIIICCNKAPKVIINNKVPENGIVLKSWQVVGPFPSYGKETFLDKDNLKLFNLSEETIEFADLIKLQKNDFLKNGNKINEKFTNRKIESQDFLFDFNKIFDYRND